MKRAFRILVDILAIYGAGTITAKLIEKYLEDHKEEIIEVIVTKLLNQIMNESKAKVETYKIYDDDGNVTYTRAEVVDDKKKPVKNRKKGVKKILSAINAALDKIGENDEK